MKKVATSAPTKVILFGEHFVVYGAPAVAIPIEIRNKITARETSGTPLVKIDNPIGGGVVYPDLRGHPVLKGYAEIVGFIFKSEKFNPDNEWNFKVIPASAPKGMGMSASIFSAFSLAVYSMLGKTPSGKELFDAVQVGEAVAHGGRPSGIDAQTVISGRPQLFRKLFSPPGFEFRDIDVSLPEDSGLLIVSTFRGKRSSTGDMIEKFAKEHKITKKPEELTEAERNGLFKEYLEIEERLVAELTPAGSLEKIGGFFLENQKLLRSVSTKEIDDVISIALKSGAAGGKLTGAGGSSGAVIIVAENGKLGKIRSALKAANYESIVAAESNSGTRMDDIYKN